MSSTGTAEWMLSGAGQPSMPTSLLIKGINNLGGSLFETSSESASTVQSEVRAGNENSSSVDRYVLSIKESSVENTRMFKIRESGRKLWKDHFPTAAVDFLELQNFVSARTDSQKIWSDYPLKTIRENAWHRSCNFYGMIEAAKKLTEFPENWNGCGGVPLTIDNFNRSIDLLYLLSKYEVHNPYLYPSPRGGLIAEVGSKNSRITIIIDSDIGLLHTRNQSEQIEFDFSLGDSFNNLLKHLSGLLDR
ncbi:hypothetical protein [Granulosicoccus antarcticus]|uniref:Uncharacterized protein n=1 Tax=Granulosicoccus antarcticus IMCC3135 TaxID=1192854 RepID=A0A2Z2NH30_9GAMM|nr:hypothetical protein [Granulosicoccus antarcticus]ASJ70596.1 hypothetical protein IMCC3135_02415 [Granulosicoccus antarcticus IMCC3135]